MSAPGKPEALTNAQAAFLLDIGTGREVFAPNPSVKSALWKRGLIKSRLIGMRWWWIQPTPRGIDAINARRNQEKP